MTKPTNVRDDLRARFPKLAERADAGSRAAACKLFCIECMGGSNQDAARCETRQCWLWPHSYRAQRQAA